MKENLPFDQRVETAFKTCCAFEETAWTEETVRELLRTARDCAHKTITNRFMLRVMPENIVSHFRNAGMGINLHNITGGHLMNAILQEGKNKQADDELIETIRVFSAQAEILKYLSSCFHPVAEKDELAEEIKTFIKPLLPRLKKSLQYFFKTSKDVGEFMRITRMEATP